MILIGFVPEMIPFDRTDIETWGRKFDAKGDFPKLISKLIFETTPRGVRFHIPSGSTVFLGGWDRRVLCPEDTNPVPKGLSVWEYGANGDVTKVNRDYNERAKNCKGLIPRTPFISV